MMVTDNRKEMSGKRKVELAMITDDRYCVFTAIALTSLKSVKAKDTFYTINICLHNVSEDNIRRLKLLSAPDFNVELYELLEK